MRKDGASIGATQFTLTSTEAGPCEMLGTTLVCEKGRGGYSFGVSSLFIHSSLFSSCWSLLAAGCLLHVTLGTTN